MTDKSAAIESQIKSVIIIDDDSSIAELISNHLSKAGIVKISTMLDGEKAWQALQKDTYESIILDWKLPSVSGLALLNRIRQLPQYCHTPILIISGFLSKKDFRLLDEFPFIGMLEKPFQQAFLMRKLKDLGKDALWFSQQSEILGHVFNSLANQGGKVVAAIKELIREAPKPIPLTIAACKLLSQHKHFKEAEDLLRGILRTDPQCLLALNELGKILLLTQRLPEAREVLQRAIELSPDNLERLCLMGSVNLNMLETETAQTFFDKALTIDGASEIALSGQVLTKNVETYLSKANTSSIPSTFVSLLNTIGVSMVKSNQYQDGLEHYQSALSYVTNDADRARLAFNLGLGFMRWNKPFLAYPWMAKAVKFGNGHFEKAQKHIATLKAQLTKDGIELPLEPELIPLTEKGGISALSASDATWEELESDEPFVPSEPLTPNDNSKLGHSSAKLTSVDNSPKVKPFDFQKHSKETPMEAPKRPIVASIVKETSEKNDLAILMSEIPEAARLLNIFKSEGLHAPSTESTLKKLWQKVGSLVLRQAIHEALKTDKPSLNDIAFIAQNLASKVS